MKIMKAMDKDSQRTELLGRFAFKIQVPNHDCQRGLPFNFLVKRNERTRRRKVL